MQRVELIELAKQIAQEHDLEKDEIIEGSVNLAIFAKKMFEESWAPTSNHKNKVACISFAQVVEIIDGKPKSKSKRGQLKFDELEYLSDFLVESYHIEIIQHPIDDAYMFLYLDKLRHAPLVRNVWTWHGVQKAIDKAAGDEVPDFARLPEQVN